MRDVSSDRWRAVLETLRLAVLIAEEHHPYVGGVGSGLFYDAKKLGLDPHEPRVDAAIDLCITARSDARCWEVRP